MSSKRENWDIKKEETAEDKFSKMYEEFKTDVIRSGKLRKIREKEYYIKPSQKRRMKIAEAKMKAKQNKKRKSRGK